MDGGSGRMNPAQLLRDFKLLGTERPGDDDLGIAEMRLNSVVGGEVDGFELGKIMTQTRREPRWCVPQFEAMMKNNQKPHDRTIGSSGDWNLVARRALRGSEDGYELVCLRKQVRQEIFFHNAGLDQALEPEHGLVGFLYHNPDFRNKFSLRAGPSGGTVVRTHRSARTQ